MLTLYLVEPARLELTPSAPFSRVKPCPDCYRRTASGKYTRCWSRRSGVGPNGVGVTGAGVTGMSTTGVGVTGVGIGGAGAGVTGVGVTGVGVTGVGVTDVATGSLYV